MCVLGAVGWEDLGVKLEAREAQAGSLHSQAQHPVLGGKRRRQWSCPDSGAENEVRRRAEQQALSGWGGVDVNEFPLLLTLQGEKGTVNSSKKAG